MKLSNMRNRWVIALAITGLAGGLFVPAASASTTGKLGSVGTVSFAGNSGKLSSASKSSLSSWKTALQKASQVQVIGHAGHGVNSKSATALAKTRAQAVVTYLEGLGVTAVFTIKTSLVSGGRTAPLGADVVITKLKSVTPTPTPTPTPTSSGFTVSGSLSIPVPSGVGSNCSNVSPSVSLEKPDQESFEPIFAVFSGDLAGGTCTANWSMSGVPAGSYTLTIELGSVSDSNLTAIYLSSPYVSGGSGTHHRLDTLSVPFVVGQNLSGQNITYLWND